MKTYFCSSFNKILMCGILLLFMVTIFMGCTTFGPGTKLETCQDLIEGDYIVVGFSQIGSESIWRTANTASIQNALCKENGFFLQFHNARQKQENQIKAMRSFISQRVDYIVFSPVMQDGWETVLQEAKGAGIPVIVVDRKVSVKNDSLYTTWVGTDSRKEGEKAGEWLEEYLASEGRSEDDINIVVLQGTIGSSVQLGRRMGFDSIADKHPNWHILKQESADFTIAKGKEVMEMMLNRYQDIDVVVSQNDDMTFGAIEAIEEAGLVPGKGGDITVISFDAVHEALELVAEGKINVDVECNPEQGEYVKNIIEKLEKGEPVEKEYYVEENVFTSENVLEYLDNRTY